MKNLLLALFYFLFFSNLVAQPQRSDQNYTDLNLTFLCKKDTMNLTSILGSDNYTKINSTELVIKGFELREDSLKNISFYAGVIDNIKYRCRFTSYEKGMDRAMRLVLYKKDKEYMVIYFRINKQSEPYHAFYLPMTIPIQKGVFEVIDTEHPKLIPIKKGKK